MTYYGTVEFGTIKYEEDETKNYLKNPELQYHDLIQEVLRYGDERTDRTGTGTFSLFAPDMLKFDLQDGKTFPLFTKKKVNFNAVVDELLWFLSGSTNINDLGSTIWNQWADKDGSIGNMYGHLFRTLNGQDPYMELVKQIKEDPFSRRHVLTTWRHEYVPLPNKSFEENVQEGRGSLACCHGTVIQFNVVDDVLNMYHYQRSCDIGLGGFFNIPSYALLLMITARLTGLKAGRLSFQMGDAHIYKDHVEGMYEYLARGFLFKLPSVEIPPLEDIPTKDDIVLKNYIHQKHIKLPISI